MKGANVLGQGASAEWAGLRSARPGEKEKGEIE
jgi:hypothetical protein